MLCIFLDDTTGNPSDFDAIVHVFTSEFVTKEELPGLVDSGLSQEAKIALLNCFAHVAWLDHKDEYYNALAEALDIEPGEIFTGDYIEIGDMAYGADIINFGSAIGVYAEDTSKNALTADYEWTFTTGYSFNTQDGTMHINGVYTAASTNIGGYIYEGAFKSSQISGVFDPLIKNDGNQYTVTIYTRNLKEGQYIDFRCRTLDGTTYFHTVDITKSNPYYKKTFTSAELAILGKNMGIGMYYYFGDDKNFEDVQIRITVSTAGDATQYVKTNSGQSSLSARSNCVIISDESVSVRKKVA